jgi:hypothetical protein
MSVPTSPIGNNVNPRIARAEIEIVPGAIWQAPSHVGEYFEPSQQRG